MHGQCRAPTRVFICSNHFWNWYKLNTEFLAVLAEITPALGCRTLRKLIQSRAEIILRGDGIDRTVQRIALAPLKQI